MKSIDSLITIAKAVAALDYPESEAGWPMGHYCKMCGEFGAYDPEELPFAGESNRDWDDAKLDEYDRLCKEREARAIAAIKHKDDCAKVLADKMVATGELG